MTTTTDTPRRTMRGRVSNWRVRHDTQWADNNPNMETDNQHPMNHWRVTLRVGRRQMTVPFSTGILITKEPDAEDVLRCLALDASGWENARGGFEDWCDEYGYDTDSRRAERTYNAVERQSKRLRQLLGDERYNLLLWHTDEG